MKMISRIFLVFLFITGSLAAFEVSKILPSEMRVMKTSELDGASEELVQALRDYHDTQEFTQSLNEFFQSPHQYLDKRISALKLLLEAISPGQWTELKHQAECKLAYLQALPDPLQPQATRFELHPKQLRPMGSHLIDAYWFEYLDPLHRIGPEVKVHIDTWLATEIPNYFIFLETVEYDPLLNLFAPFEHQVEYFLTNEERSEHRLFFQNGKCFLKGELFDTGKSFSLHSDEPGFAIFTVGLDGEVYVNSHIKYKIHHSSEFAGEEVISAGELKAKEGIILEISNKSGHYAPKHREVMLMLGALKQKLGDLSGIDLVIFQYTKSGDKYHKQMATFDAEAYLEANGETAALRGSGNWTPLHVAVWNNHLRYTTDVITDKALNIKDFQGNTPLHLAVMQEHAEWVHELINAGAKLSAQNDLGETPLHCACRSGNEAIAKLLLENISYVDKRNNKEQTPLHYAAQAGSFAIFDALVEKGASLEAFDEDGNHILHFAAFNGNVLFLQKLLDSDLMSKLLQPNRRNASVLHAAAAFGDESVLKLLMQYPFDLTQKDYKGRTPLHYSAKFGNQETTSYLLKLKNHLLLSAKTHRSLTAFHYAAQNLPLDSIKEFIEAGVKINAVDYKGRSAIFYAITGRSVNSLRNLKYLLCHGAYTHIYNTKGQAPVHYAAARGSVSSLRRILTSSNDWNLQDSQGRTPLDIAIEKKYPMMTQYLSEHHYPNCLGILEDN